MAIEVTVTVKTDNNFDETVITKTLRNGDGNPRYDGSHASALGAEALGHVVVQLNRLVDSPLIDSSVNAVTLTRQSFLEKLREKADLLDRLMRAGVDNWEGYDDAAMPTD